VTNPSWDPGGSYTMVFDDEFTGSSLNATYWGKGWQASSGVSGPINALETAAYSSSNVSVSGGFLNLALTSGSPDGGAHPNTGACVTTNTNGTGGSSGFSFTLGAAEARVYFPPPGSGSAIPNWPAWWLDGQNWPTTGEIDIVEGLSGFNAYHNHTSANSSGVGSIAPTPYNQMTGFHTYGINWTLNQVDFYYDGAFVGTITTGMTSSIGPLYLIFDYTSGSPGGTTQTGLTMQVDWVRVWTPGPPATIPAMATLTDSFSNSATLGSQWNGSSSGVSISGGQAVIPCNSDQYFVPGTVYDLQGSYMYVEVPTVASGTGCTTDIGATNSATSESYVQWTYLSGNLTAQLQQAGSLTNVGSVTYNATTHKWWRIRESGGSIFWDTAPDGSTWTNRFSHTYNSSELTVTGLVPYLEAFPGSVTTTTAFMDSFNGGTPSITSAGTLALTAFNMSGTASESGTGTLALQPFGLSGNVTVTETIALEYIGPYIRIYLQYVDNSNNGATLVAVPNTVYNAAIAQGWSGLALPPPDGYWQLVSGGAHAPLRVQLPVSPVRKPVIAPANTFNDPVINAVITAAEEYARRKGRL
jgi:beta-glucanase (GH16 family)